MTILEYLNRMRPALPLGKEKASKEKPHAPPSNGELKRWINDGSVLINGDRWKHDEQMPPIVLSLVFFPKSPKNRTTLV